MSSVYHIEQHWYRKNISIIVESYTGQKYCRFFKIKGPISWIAPQPVLAASLPFQIISDIFCSLQPALNHIMNESRGKDSNLDGICSLIALCFGWVNELLFSYPKQEFGNHLLLGHTTIFQLRMTHCLKISSSRAQTKVYQNHILLRLSPVWQFISVI